MKIFKCFFIASLLSCSISQSFGQENNPEEYYQLGLQYRDGKVLNYPKNSPAALAKAKEIFLELAEKGNLKAMHNAAMIFYNEENYDSAFHWFSKAADLGLEASINNLKKMAENGILARIMQEEAARKAQKVEETVQATSSRATSSERVGSTVQETYSFKDLAKRTKTSLSLNNLNGALQWFEKQLDYLRGYSFEYTQSFLEMISWAGKDEVPPLINVDKSFQELQAWNDTLKELFKRDKGTVINLAVTHLNQYLQPDSSLTQKLPAIIFQAHSGTNNLFYDAMSSKILIEEFLSKMSPDSPETKQASLYVQDHINSGFGLDKINQPPLSLVETTLLEKLSLVGTHWDRLVYTDLFVDVVTTPKFGEFDPELKNQLMKDQHFLNFARQSLSLEPDTSIEEMIQKPEFNQFLSEQSRPVIAMEVISDNRIPYVGTAIRYVMEQGNLAEAISLYRVLSHGGGFKPMSAAHSLNTLVKFSGSLSHSLHLFASQLQILAKYLSEKNTPYDPIAITGDKIKIQEIKSFTFEQNVLIQEVIKEESVREVLAKRNGGIRTGRNFMSNGRTFIDGNYFGVGDYSAIGGIQVINGIVLVIANEFKLTGTIDALNGIVIIADTFDVAGAKIYNPKNCHFIKKSDSLFPLQYRG